MEGRGGAGHGTLTPQQSGRPGWASPRSFLWPWWCLWSGQEKCPWTVGTVDDSALTEPGLFGGPVLGGSCGDLILPHPR